MILVVIEVVPGHGVDGQWLSLVLQNEPLVLLLEFGDLCVLLLTIFNQLVIVLELWVAILNALILNANSFLQNRVVSNQVHYQCILFREYLSLNFIFVCLEHTLKHHCSLISGWDSEKRVDSRLSKHFFKSLVTLDYMLIDQWRCWRWHRVRRCCVCVAAGIHLLLYLLLLLRRCTHNLCWWTANLCLNIWCLLIITWI